MTRAVQIAVLSDIHYASAAEQARGDHYENGQLKNPFKRHLLGAYRHYVWLRHPLRQNHRLDQFLERVGSPDYVVANGDYSCDSAFVGVSDDAACQSARECLEKLRRAFGPNFNATIGDHELGKVGFIGGRGGMRVASWHRATGELGLQPFWRLELGNYVLLGVASSLLALPVFEPDTLLKERQQWRALRESHLAEIRRAFAALQPGQRVLLFCHDPTALPFLAQDETIRAKLPHIERTIIGHLHSNLLLWKSRLLAGMPPIRFLGHTTKRLSTALSQARHWRPFHVRLCPALAGIQLLKDGGYLTIQLDPSAHEPAKIQFHRLGS